MTHPFLNCNKCPPNERNVCNYPSNGICVREATLPPAVCPMFDDIPIDECPGIDYKAVGITVRAIPP